MQDFVKYILPYLSERKKNDIYAQVQSVDSWGGLIREEDLVGEMKIAQAPRVKFRPCRWTFDLMVMYDGRVRASSCRFNGREIAEGRDALVVGDITENTLGEIWNGEDIRILRRSFGQGYAPGVCTACTMYRPI